MSTSLHVVSLGLHSWVCHPRFEALHCRLSRAGERETLVTYSTLALVVGGVIVASGVEPSLNLFGAAICFLGAAFRGLRAVLQVRLCHLVACCSTAPHVALFLGVILLGSLLGRCTSPMLPVSLRSLGRRAHRDSSRWMCTPMPILCGVRVVATDSFRRRVLARLARPCCSTCI